MDSDDELLYGYTTNDNHCFLTVNNPLHSNMKCSQVTKSID